MSFPKGAEPVSNDLLTQTLLDSGVSAPDALDSLASTVATIVDAADPAVLSDADPLAVGTADPGVSTDVSRADHVHGGAILSDADPGQVANVADAGLSVDASRADHEHPLTAASPDLYDIAQFTEIGWTAVPFPVIITGSGAPSGAPPTNQLPLYMDTATKDLYAWDGAAWQGPYSVAA